MALKSSDTSKASDTTMSSGRRPLAARGKRSQGMEERVRKLATYRSAWTPASVRPQPVTLTGSLHRAERARSRVSATVAWVFCTCQPW